MIVLYDRKSNWSTKQIKYMNTEKSSVSPPASCKQDFEKEVDEILEDMVKKDLKSLPFKIKGGKIDGYLIKLKSDHTADEVLVYLYGKGLDVYFDQHTNFYSHLEGKTTYFIAVSPKYSSPESYWVNYCVGWNKNMRVKFTHEMADSLRKTLLLVE